MSVDYDGFETHCLLRKKNQGASRKLIGDITVINLFVSDAESQWDAKSIDAFTQKAKSAARLLETAAAERSVKLHIRIANGRVCVDQICRPPICDWAETVLLEYGKRDTEEFQNHYEEVFCCDEAPVQFVFNKKFRSCASAADIWNPKWNEFSVLTVSDSAWTIVHELLHQFGAVDMYYPESVKNAAKRWLPANYMNGGYAVDSLTAFLIGWETELDAQAKNFLTATRTLTMEDIRQAITKEWEKQK